MFEFDTAGVYDNKNLGSFLAGIKKERFIDYKYKNAIPSFIRAELECLAGNFSMANPNEEYQCCCVSFKELPERKLLSLSVSKHTIHHELSYRRNWRIHSYPVDPVPGPKDR